MSVNISRAGTRNVTVLVTGAGGYIGSHACLALLEAGFNVVALDNMVNCWKGGKSAAEFFMKQIEHRLSPCMVTDNDIYIQWRCAIDGNERLSQPESLIRVQILAGRQLRFYHAELLCKTSLEKIFEEIIQEFEKIDVCMHFAALKAVGESCSKPLQYYKNNISGTINLIETLAKFGCTSLIYSSSATVYGDPSSLPILETDPTGVNLTNPYGKTKYMTEEILKDLCNAMPEWRVISLRYFNPVGAHSSGLIGEDPNGIPNNLVPFVAQVAAGKLPSLKVFGGDYPTKDGTGVRDYIHITDLIDGHVKALEFILKDFKGFKTYNLGTGKGFSVLEVIRAFEEASKRDIPYEIVGRRAGDIAASYCDASLAQVELGWVALRDINDMCQDVWRWQSRNINGFKKETDPNCLLHSPKKLELLLSNLTKLEQQKAERKLHLEAIEAFEELRMKEDFEKLKRLREVLKAFELLRLSRGEGVCQQNLSGPGAPKIGKAKLLEDYEKLKKLRSKLQPNEVERFEGKKAHNQDNAANIGLPFCCCKQ